MIISETHRKRLIPLLVWLVFCSACLIWLFVQPVKLSLHLRSEKIFILKLDCYGDASEGKKLSFQETVNPAKNRYDFSLPRWTRKIRLNLGHDADNLVSLSGFSLVRNGIFSYRQDLLSMRDMQTCHDVAAAGQEFKTTGYDPWLELSPALLENCSLDLRRFSLLVLVFLAVSAVLFRLRADS